MDTKKEALLLFSGGKDSFLSGCCLIEKDFKIHMVTFENGTGLKASKELFSQQKNLLDF